MDSHIAPRFATANHRSKKARVIAAVVLLPALLGLAAACGEDGENPLPDLGGSATTSAAASPRATGPGVLTISTGGLFEPDSIEIAVDTVVMLENESDRDLVLAVNGDDNPDGPLEIEIGAGESAQLELPGPGAYVITSPGNTSLTATVMVR